MNCWPAVMWFQSWSIRLFILYYWFGGSLMQTTYVQWTVVLSIWIVHSHDFVLSVSLVCVCFLFYNFISRNMIMDRAERLPFPFSRETCISIKILNRCYKYQLKQQNINQSKSVCSGKLGTREIQGKHSDRGIEKAHKYIVAIAISLFVLSLRINIDSQLREEQKKPNTAKSTAGELFNLNSVGQKNGNERGKLKPKPKWESRTLTMSEWVSVSIAYAYNWLDLFQYVENLHWASAAGKHSHII